MTLFYFLFYVNQSSVLLNIRKNKFYLLAFCNANFFIKKADHPIGYGLLFPAYKLFPVPVSVRDGGEVGVC